MNEEFKVEFFIKGKVNFKPDALSAKIEKIMFDLQDNGDTDYFFQQLHNVRVEISDPPKDKICTKIPEVAACGVFPLCKGNGTNNHFAMTRKALDALGFHYNVVDWIAMGSTMTDLWLAHKREAHATTGEGITPDTFTKNWMPDLLKGVEDSQNRNLPGLALCLLGFFCHGIQDLHVHNGISEEMHIWLNRKKQSPDDNFDTEQVVNFTQETIQKLLENERLRELKELCLGNHHQIDKFLKVEPRIAEHYQDIYFSKTELITNLTVRLPKYLRRSNRKWDLLTKKFQAKIENLTKEEVNQARWWTTLEKRNAIRDEIISNWENS